MLSEIDSELYQKEATRAGKEKLLKQLVGAFRQRALQELIARHPELEQKLIDIKDAKTQSLTTVPLR